MKNRLIEAIKVETEIRNEAKKKVNSLYGENTKRINANSSELYEMRTALEKFNRQTFLIKKLTAILEAQ